MITGSPVLSTPAKSYFALTSCPESSVGEVPRTKIGFPRKKSHGDIASRHNYGKKESG